MCGSTYSKYPSNCDVIEDFIVVLSQKCQHSIVQGVFSLGLPLKVPSKKMVIQARSGGPVKKNCNCYRSLSVFILLRIQCMMSMNHVFLVCSSSAHLPPRPWVKDGWAELSNEFIDSIDCASNYQRFIVIWSTIISTHFQPASGREL